MLSFPTSKRATAPVSGSASASRRHAVLAVALSASACAVFAQTTMQPATAGQPQVMVMERVEVKQQNGVSYVTGGIGDAGQARTKMLGKDMSLALVFAKAKGGNYVADIDVQVTDKSGKKVLAVKSSDPMLYVQLPPGSYKVTASAAGKSIERNVDVPATGQRTENIQW